MEKNRVSNLHKFWVSVLVAAQTGHIDSRGLSCLDMSYYQRLHLDNATNRWRSFTLLFGKLLAAVVQLNSTQQDSESSTKRGLIQKRTNQDEMFLVSSNSYFDNISNVINAAIKCCVVQSGLGL